MIATHETTTHWHVDVYAWKSIHPSEDNFETDIYDGTPNITSINVSRSKDNPSPESTISVRGRPNSFWMIGNWVVVYTKKGAFEGDSYEEGVPIFIGQITHIQYSFAREPSGALVQMTNVRMRPWSSLLQTPIIYDIFGIMQTYKTDASIIGTINSFVTNTKSSPYTNMLQVSSDICNPWRYAVLVLSFLGAVAEKTKSAVVEQMQKNGMKIGSSESIAENYQEVATKMPKIPAKLLENLGYDSSVTPDNAFKAENGFMHMLLGVQTKNMRNEILTDGCFGSLDALSTMYEPSGDRPILSNVGPEFSQGHSAWNLIREKTDRDNSTEMFCDIWYYREGKRILARPVFVLRDKPFMLKKFKDNMSLSTKWSTYDDIPTVSLPESAISRINISNTFFQSPNYTTCRFTSPTIAPNSDVAHDVFRLTRVKSQAEMNRFGGITYTYNTPYVAQASINYSETQKTVNLDWYKDLAFVQWAWHNNDYRTWNGTIQMHDPTIPISVGLNVSFLVGKFLCSAHVTSVSYTHTVTGSGVKMTHCNIGFSHLVVVRKSDSLYEYAGTQFHSQAFSTKFEEDVDVEGSPVSVPFSSYKDALDVASSERDETINKLES